MEISVAIEIILDCGGGGHMTTLEIYSRQSALSSHNSCPLLRILASQQKHRHGKATSNTQIAIDKAAGNELISGHNTALRVLLVELY